MGWHGLDPGPGLPVAPVIYFLWFVLPQHKSLAFLPEAVSAHVWLIKPFLEAIMEIA